MIPSMMINAYMMVVSEKFNRKNGLKIEPMQPIVKDRYILENFSLSS